MILEIPPIITEAPTSVPIAHKELEGHFARISMATRKVTMASKRNHPHPSDWPHLERRGCLHSRIDKKKRSKHHRQACHANSGEEGQTNTGEAIEDG